MVTPHVPFYFIRHGETDWNRKHQALCNQDDIPLNENGLQQALAVRKRLSSLGITQLYASPFERAKQTAEIINKELELPLKFHEGLREIVDEKVMAALACILEPSHITLIVSHGEVYRILVRVLNAQATSLHAQNCGIYLFTPPHNSSNQWTVHTL